VSRVQQTMTSEVHDQSSAEIERLHEALAKRGSLASDSESRERNSTPLSVKAQATERTRLQPATPPPLFFASPDTAQQVPSYPRGQSTAFQSFFARFGALFTS